MGSTLVVFEGEDSNADFGLWVTDGTAAGTSELSVAGADASGVFALYSPTAPTDAAFTVLGSTALFGGADSSGNVGLWVTDGTAAGTSELSVAGASSSGLFPIGAAFMGGTVLGSTMLFEGEDSSGKFGLLVTDGTAAGTSELSVAGADASGLLSGDSDYPDFMVLGSKALFEGEDASGNGGLWVTDGTAAGTSELSVAGASSGGLDPNFFTVFGSKVLFGGEDSSGNRGLWVTDGTAAGTSEIATASNAYGGLGPSSFTVFGSKVLFNGTDSSGNSGLWVTDGTAGGTSELSVAGLSSAELVEGFGSGSAVLGAKVLFSGIDSSGDAISG